jgi:hypothetical protein
MRRIWESDRMRTVRVLLCVSRQCLVGARLRERQANSPSDFRVLAPAIRSDAHHWLKKGGGDKSNTDTRVCECECECVCVCVCSCAVGAHWRTIA